MSKRVIRAAVAAVGALALGSGAALAASTVTSIIGSNGVIHGCFNETNGNLRVIDAEGGAGCRQDEAAISWNHIGAQGPKGDPGPAGPPGERGPAGPAASVHAAMIGPDDSVQWQRGVESVESPDPGSYLVRFDRGVAFLGRPICAPTATLVGAAGQIAVSVEGSAFLGSSTVRVTTYDGDGAPAPRRFAIALVC